MENLSTENYAEMIGRYESYAAQVNEAQAALEAVA